MMKKWMMMKIMMRTMKTKTLIPRKRREKKIEEIENSTMETNKLKNKLKINEK